MIIYQLLISNFKSYNGDHVIGPFDSHFNCVIGPNGNGKSNIIDAVCFVFGFKSSKLRQDSLSSLIHRSAFAQPDKASVAVTFKEEGEFLKVSRSVTKGGTTYYKLNDAKVTWNELRQRLISKKIDLNKNLFIILQGEVQRLCQLQPITMIDYLEYISGSDELKEPIEQTETSYIDASVKRQQTKMNSAVKRKMFEGVQQRVEDMTAKILTKLRITMLQHLIIKKNVLDNRKKLEKYGQEEAFRVGVIEQIENDVREIEGEIQRKREELGPLEARIRQYSGSYNSLQVKYDTITLMIKEAQRDVTFLSKDREKKNQERVRLDGEKNSLVQISENQKDVIERVKSINEALNKEKQRDRLQLCLDLQTKLANLEEEQQRLVKKNTDDSGNLTIGREKLRIFVTKEAQNKKQKHQLKQKLKGFQLEKKEVEAKLSEAEQVIDQLQRQLKTRKNQKVMSSSIQQKIISQIRSANKLKLLCPELTLVTLRDIVILNSIYQEVIETILPQLDYFIVDNVAQARSIADYLKKKKIGRMTFIIKELINQAVKDIKIVPSSPNNTKLIIDLIRFTDNDAKNMLIWALGNTLVTHDLETAMKVAYYDEKRFRVVTTKGQFIDSSGTMTKLSLKSAIVTEDQEFHQKKIDTLRRLRSNLSDRSKQLQNSIKEANERLQSISVEERSFDGLDEVIMDELQKEVLKDRKTIVKSTTQIDQFAQNLQQLKNQLQKSNFNLSTYSLKIQMLRQIAENHDKIKKIQNSANILLNLEQKITDVDKEIQNFTSKMEMKMKQKITLETQQAKITNQMQAQQMQVTSLEQSAAAITGEITHLEGQKSMKLGRLGSGRNGTNQKLKEELNKLRSAVRNVEYQQIELKNRLENSLAMIKEFSWSIFKNIYKKHPQLIHELEESVDLSEITIEYVYQSLPPLQLGKIQLSFTSLLSQAQQDYLQSPSPSKQSIYKTPDSILPSSQDSQLLFDSIQSKEIKLSHAYQLQKLKHHEGSASNLESCEIDSDLYADYKEKKEEFDGIRRQLQVIEREVELRKQELIELRNRRLHIFMTNFNEINFELNRIYCALTGGKAELNFIDSMNPFQGVQFSVRPVNKSWKRVNLLSGGEKTFTSLSLIFACEEIKAFPFYFMDEIDAALDYKNTTLLAHYIKEKKNTQHIVISLRKNMYQECNRLVGIYKVKDQSRVIEIGMEQLRNQEREQS